MKNITDAIGGLGGIFNPSRGNEETSPDNTPSVSSETAVSEETVSEEKTTVQEENVTEEETAVREETSVSEENTVFDIGGIFDEKKDEESASTVETPPAPRDSDGVQLPIFLFVILIGAVCILGAAAAFLAFKLKKSKNKGSGAYQIPDVNYPVSTAVNPNPSAEAPSNAKPVISPEKSEETKVENVCQPSDVPVTVVPSEIYSKHEFSYMIGNVHNQGRREEQQDSFCISDISNKADLKTKGLMAVVADGMGGLESGASVSQLVSNIFLNKYRVCAIPDCSAFLYDAVMESEREVEKYIAANHVDGGSTLVAVMIRDGLLSFISVGDSFIFMIRAGKLIKLNTEHTYGNLLRERAAKGEIDPEEAEINPKRASLTSYIGIGNLRLIDQSGTPIKLAEGDILFLCSDGVYNALGDNALLEVVTGGDFGEAAERVEQAVLMQNIPTQDNFTAVMIKIMGGK